jgi:hypothetical protein
MAAWNGRNVLPQTSQDINVGGFAKKANVITT